MLAAKVFIQVNSFKINKQIKPKDIAFAAQAQPGGGGEGVGGPVPPF